MSRRATPGSRRQMKNEMPARTMSIVRMGVEWTRQNVTPFSLSNVRSAATERVFSI